ncbi:SRPBCC domain-containing protein [Actinocorallia longicatena]|uniref:SRPBCC domain-containing protein n=2 Tax=Actinocorallia longicatena TaxID=111803 RepID=A0ABP6Q7W3_9ACTN
MGQVFKALADTTRRRLLDRLHAGNGQTLGALCRDLEITRQGITQHLAVLEAAGLVVAVRRGREKLHYLNPVPLHEIHVRWIAKFERADLDALSTLKHDLEQYDLEQYDPDQKEKPVEKLAEKPKLVYVTYIASTPERVWSALTDPEQTARYWGHRNVSTWEKGAGWEHVGNERGDVQIVGTILEIDPPRRLVHTWAGLADADDPARRSRVTFEIEPAGDTVRLSVTHEDLPQEQLAGTRNGWERVLASLKSMLETGQGLPSIL